MKQYLTQLDLIRYIYRETSAAEAVEINVALSEDPLLMEEYRELYLGYLQLPKAKFSPKPSALQNILSYSEQTALNPMH
ncbi:MAG: hypothetical protein IPM82_24905 [Saprospiraceae bacterium]|nr:hypothetical protein [Saprospiraceae bacterium]